MNGHWYNKQEEEEEEEENMIENIIDTSAETEGVKGLC
jgi:hypothetical protein